MCVLLSTKNITVYDFVTFNDNERQQNGYSYFFQFNFESQYHSDGLAYHLFVVSLFLFMI
jgi:hypothetical protein